LPKVPEALILHHADNVDAKMEMFRAAYEGAAMLGERVVQRESPMQTNVVLPLPVVQL
jgi:3'-5' exoribonuclease